MSNTIRNADWIETAISAIDTQIADLEEARKRLLEISNRSKARPKRTDRKIARNLRDGSISSRVATLIREINEPLTAEDILKKLSEAGTVVRPHTLRVTLHRLTRSGHIRRNDNGYYFHIGYNVTPENFPPEITEVEVKARKMVEEDSEEEEEEEGESS